MFNENESRKENGKRAKWQEGKKARGQEGRKYLFLPPCPSPTSEAVKQIIDKVLNISTADETEIFVGGGHSALTRFAENHIHQNVAENSFGIRVRAIIDKQMGEASISKFDDDSLKKVVADAIEIAKVTPPDPELLPLPGPQTYQPVEAYYEESISPMQRAKYIAKAITLCKTAGFKAAGIFSNGNSYSAMGNSNGLFAYHRSSAVNFSITVMGDNSSGWAQKYSRKSTDIETEKLAEIAIQKAGLSNNPKTIEPGKYTVILEPDAVAGLIGYLSFGFNALAVDEGRSYLVGKMGKRIAGESISLRSDVYHPLHQGQPYDGEGIPTRRVELIKNGIAAGLVYDRLAALKHNVESTGHGEGGHNSYGAFPDCLVMDGGDATIGEMIASTERGVLVTHFHYQNLVDPMQVIVTGMTRDGTFWIENGKIQYGLKNLRFNQKILEMLNNVEMMSEPVLASGMVVPAMKVNQFNFSSGTEF
jgi:predicted Zn-dependent protease